jgi:hypothetical protein
MIIGGVAEKRVYSSPQRLPNTYPYIRIACRHWKKLNVHLSVSCSSSPEWNNNNNNNDYENKNYKNKQTSVVERRTDE